MTEVENQVTTEETVAEAEITTAPAEPVLPEGGVVEDASSEPAEPVAEGEAPQAA